MAARASSLAQRRRTRPLPTLAGGRAQRTRPLAPPPRLTPPHAPAPRWLCRRDPRLPPLPAATARARSRLLPPNASACACSHHTRLLPALAGGRTQRTCPLRPHRRTSPLRALHALHRFHHEFDVQPQVHACNRVLGALAAAGHVEDVLKLFDEMSEGGVQYIQVMFGIVVRALAHAGMTDRLLKMIGRMQNEVCWPDVFVYTEL